jgi:Uma2 family endonuclease
MTPKSITIPRKMTLEEYLTYDDGTDQRYELDEGYLILMPPATGRHELIAGLLLTYFSQAIQQQGLDLYASANGVEFLTRPQQPRKPDICLISRQQAQAIWGVSAILSTPPVLAVEVVSPESVKRDYQTKLLEYAQAGVPEYWIVDPLQAKVTVLSLREENYLAQEFMGEQIVRSPLLPSWMVTVDQILNPLGK